jgi:hypothetical protein
VGAKLAHLGEPLILALVKFDYYNNYQRSSVDLDMLDCDGSDICYYIDPTILVRCRALRASGEQDRHPEALELAVDAWRGHAFLLFGKSPHSCTVKYTRTH